MKRHFVSYALRFALAALLVLASVAHAAERLLYEKSSPYNHVIVSEDEQGLRTLRFERGGARQSVVKPGDPDYLGFAYTPAAFVGLALAADPQRFLVVGLGGGTMPMFLRKRYPEATIDAVDIDPDVVYVAKEFFGFREDERMRAHVADGRQFIEALTQPYDVIFLDAFGARNVPAALTTVEFLSAVRRGIKPGGVVVGNIWGPGSNPSYESMVRTYQEVFDDLYILEVAGTANRILFALPRRQAFDRDDLVQLARKVGQARRFPFDLGDISRHGFEHASRKYDSGNVLRDADAERPRRARTN
jgi:spermidine synthase